MFDKNKVSRKLNRIAKELVSASGAEYRRRFRDAWTPFDSDVADKEGDYQNFTGTIDYEGTKGEVKNASFLLDEKVFMVKGIWLDGTWKGGRFHTALWKNGTWKGGIFCDKSIWKNGTWERGVFCGDAVWENGTWKDGDFCEATWEDGTWEDGHFYGEAVWENGIWKNGYFSDKAVWENGTWKNGFFYENAVWLDGTWEKGSWEGGKDEYGHFHEDGDSPDKW